MNITYAPLWRTMKKRGVSTYALKHKLMIGGGTYARLKTDQSVSTNTISLLCEYLDCEVDEVMCRVRAEHRSAPAIEEK